MTSDRLARAYLQKAAIRLKALSFLHQEGGYSDVVREAQECVEILLKGVLRCLGIEVPKIHDVSRILKQRFDLLPPLLQETLEEVSQISRELRKDRELSFYGADDWIPTEEYSDKDALEAIRKARRVFEIVSQIIPDVPQ
jgi:HEPN domain-containing protein